ncbi:hypothetical protein LINPERPRIM_LOCUS22085 [Linum perenne]
MLLWRWEKGIKPLDLSKKNTPEWITIKNVPPAAISIEGISWLTSLIGNHGRTLCVRVWMSKSVYFGIWISPVRIRLKLRQRMVNPREWKLLEQQQEITKGLGKSGIKQEWLFIRNARLLQGQMLLLFPRIIG